MPHPLKGKKEQAFTLYQGGMSKNQIADKLKISRRTMQRWANDWQDETLEIIRQTSREHLQYANRANQKTSEVMAEAIERYDKLLDFTAGLEERQRVTKAFHQQIIRGLQEIKKHPNPLEVVGQLEILSRIYERVDKLWRLHIGMATERIEVDLTKLDDEVLMQMADLATREELGDLIDVKADSSIDK